jgi:hypothetical protein
MSTVSATQAISSHSQIPFEKKCPAQAICPLSLCYDMGNFNSLAWWSTIYSLVGVGTFSWAVLTSKPQKIPLNVLPNPIINDTHSKTGYHTGKNSTPPAEF